MRTAPGLLRGRTVAKGFGIAAATLVLWAADRYSKMYVEAEFVPYEPYPVIADFLRINHQRNYGLAWGICSGADSDPYLMPSRLLVVGGSLVFLLAAARFFISRRPGRAGGDMLQGPDVPAPMIEPVSRGFPRFSGTAAVVLLTASVAGNLIDRERFGYVVDFIDIGIGDVRLPAVNLADLYFIVLVLLFVIQLRPQSVVGPYNIIAVDNLKPARSPLSERLWCSVSHTLYLLIPILVMAVSAAALGFFCEFYEGAMFQWVRRISEATAFIVLLLCISVVFGGSGDNEKLRK